MNTINKDKNPSRMYIFTHNIKHFIDIIAHELSLEKKEKKQY